MNEKGLTEYNKSNIEVLLGKISSVGLKSKNSNFALFRTNERTFLYKSLTEASNTDFYAGKFPTKKTSQG